MKKGLLLSIALLLVALLIFASQWQGQSLLSQLLGTSPSTDEVIVKDDIGHCKSFSEAAANQCLMQLAINENDTSICDEITKSTEITECRREVELNNA